jgi:hypothetical protein
MLTEKKPWDLIFFFFFPIDGEINNWRQFLQGKRKLKKKGSKIILKHNSIHSLLGACRTLRKNTSINGQPLSRVDYTSVHSRGTRLKKPVQNLSFISPKLCLINTKIKQSPKFLRNPKLGSVQLSESLLIFKTLSLKSLQNQNPFPKQHDEPFFLLKVHIYIYTYAYSVIFIYNIVLYIMQLKSGSGLGSSSSPTGARLRKKHKRLDAICETVYNQNHSESLNEEKSGSGQAADLELRRSSRVRRAPELLDVSPPPAKKRKKMKKKVNLGVSKSYRSGNSSYKIGNSSLRSGNSSSKRVMEEEEEDSEGEEDLDDTPGSWRSRLRTRGRNAGKGGSSGESRRRKLFDDMEAGESELGEGEGGFDGGKFVMGSKRVGRVKALSGLESEEKEGGNGHGSGNVSENDEDEEGEEDDEMEVVRSEDSDESVLDLGGEIDGGNEEEIGDDDGVQVKGEEEKERLDGLELERKGDGNENVENVEDDEKMEELVMMDAENERDVDEVNGALVNELEDGQCGADEIKKDDVENADLTKGVEDRGCCDKNEKDVVEEYVDLTKEVENKGGLDELEGEKDVKVDKMKRDSTSSLGRSKIKQGRCCGLCGCGNDGKPPKRLVQDGGESENEAYSGSSASEDVKYDVWDGFGDEPGWLGRLLGPINDRYGIAGIWVHQNCAVWSPEVQSYNQFYLFSLFLVNFP